MRRGAALTLIASLVLVACAGGEPAAPRAPVAGPGPLLIPSIVLTGAWVAEGTDPRSAPRRFQQVLAPTAVTVNGPDLFYVDAALGALLRYDSHLQRLRRVLPLRAWPGMRLWALPDSSLYILDPRTPSLLRVTRDGRVLERTTDASVLGGVAEFAIFERTGQILLADRGANRVRVLSRDFGAAVEVPLQRSDRLRLDAVWSIAAGRDAWYVLDRSRRQVVRIDDTGRLLQAFGESILKLPSAIGVDRYERVFVADEVGPSIHVFERGRHRETIAAAALGLPHILALQAQGSNLVLGGDGNAGIRVFHLAAPREKPL